jgi:hypothetical protein
MIVGMAVPVLFAVRLIVLFIVGDEVVEIESVMRGDEIDARPGLSPALVEEIARSGNALGEIRQYAGIAFPEAAHGVAELIIPFRPSRWELPDLVAAGADIPGLSDQFDAVQYGILPAGI